jgi:gluconate 2-dehydrogenase gamma chain
MDDQRLNRRHFLIAGVSAASIATASIPEAANAVEIRGKEPWEPHRSDAPHPDTAPTFIYFTPAEAAFVDAATERLIPADDLGPGANACHVTLFIDHQLAGAYGRAQSWYMLGPWAKGTETQGFQSRLNPADMYRAAIKAIDAHVATGRNGKTFAGLSAAAQDSLLTAMEGGKLPLTDVDAESFFKMLLLNTKEGMFSDPIYGGNKDMAGWKMLGFPGARYDYREWVGKHGQRFDLPPVGLKGRPDWNQKS